MIEIIQLLLQLVKANPILWLGVLGLVVLTWLSAMALTAMVGALPAPTAMSSPRYVFWFKTANSFVGMLQRAKSTAIENSPNFLPAVERYVFQRYGIRLPSSPAVVTDWQQNPKE